MAVDVARDLNGMTDDESSSSSDEDDEDPAGTRRVARLKIYGYVQRKKMVTERAARLWKDQKANPPLRCNSPTSASNTAQ